ncbi:MAG: ABC-2 transporter permease [Alistipes sp.]|nr:ABC-2 transporter permease [Alistipes sp.]
MRDYINQLLQLFKKHYIERKNTYISLMLALFGIPLLFAFMSKNSVTVATLYVTMILVSMAVVLHVSTVELRNSHSYIIAHTLPVSTAVNYGFILLNSVVVAFVMVAICYFPALAIAKAIYPPMPEFDWTYDVFFGNGRTYLGILATHGVLLIVNLVGKKRIFLTYLVALLLAMAVQLMINEYIAVEWRENAKLIGNILLIFVAWIGGYFILRNYQIRS